MSEVLTGRRILITGGASGIGLAIAREFSAAGARVAMLDRSEDGLTKAAKEINASVVLADVTVPAAVTAAVADAAKALGGIDGIVNAAGVSLWRTLEDMTYEEWRHIMSINLDGPFLVCKAAIGELKRAGSGTIVNIGSSASFKPMASRSAYSASKAGTVMMTKVLAMELVQFNIRVNALCPGLTDTPMVERTLSISADREQRTRQFIERTSMKRFARPEEIAKLALFLTGPDSSFTTGSAYSADGGAIYH